MTSNDTQTSGFSSANGNSNAPIAILADDILHEIFMQIMDNVSKGNDKSPKDLRTRIAVSQVCRYWRNLALATPLLWSRIYVEIDTSVNMVRRFVQRSVDISLKVTFVGWEKRRGERCADTQNRLLDAAEVLSAESHRIVELSIGKHWPAEFSNIFKSFIYFRMPQLRVFRLGEQVVPSTWIPFPSRALLFGGQLPPLRQLRIDMLADAWETCRGLTVLILTNQPAPEIQTLLSTLTNCPELKTLTLRMHGVCAVDRSIPSIRTRIALPRLKGLTLLSKQVNIEQILQALAFPATTWVHLGFDGPWNHPALLNKVCRSLDAIVSRVADATLTMYQNHGYGLRLAATDRSFLAEWICDAIPNNPDVAGLERMGFRGLAFPALRRLTIAAAPYGLSSDEWKHVFELVPKLHTLNIATRDGAREPLFLALSSPCGAPTDPPAVVCPALAELFVPHYALDVALDRVVIKIIEACFRMRAMVGATLSTFEMTLSPGPRISRDLVRGAEEELEKLKRIIRLQLGPQGTVPPTERARQTPETFFPPDITSNFAPGMELTRTTDHSQR